MTTRNHQNTRYLLGQAGPSWGSEPNMNHYDSAVFDSYTLYAQNRPLNLPTRSYHAIYRTGSQTHITEETVTIRTAAPISETDTDNVEWNGSARWRSLNQPCPFDTPAGVFDCFALQD